MTALPSIVRDTVTLSPEEQDGGVVLVAKGTIEDRVPGEWMNPYFSKLHEAIYERHLSEITLDFRELANVNSSGIVCLLAWVKKIQALPEGRYQLKVLHDPNILWHRITLKSLQAMAPGVVQVVEN